MEFLACNVLLWVGAYLFLSVSSNVLLSCQLGRDIFLDVLEVVGFCVCWYPLEKSVCPSSVLYHLFYWCDWLIGSLFSGFHGSPLSWLVWALQLSDTDCKTQGFFLGHLSMLQRKRNHHINVLYQLLVCTLKCSWIFYCWCKLCISGLQLPLPLPPPRQMFVKLNPRMLAIDRTLVFFIVDDDFADWRHAG